MYAPNREWHRVPTGPYEGEMRSHVIIYFRQPGSVLWGRYNLYMFHTYTKRTMSSNFKSRTHLQSAGIRFFSRGSLKVHTRSARSPATNVKVPFVWASHTKGTYEQSSVSWPQQLEIKWHWHFDILMHWGIACWHAVYKISLCPFEIFLLFRPLSLCLHEAI